MAKHRISQSSDDVKPLTRLPSNSSRVSWVQGDAKQLWIVFLRYDIAVEHDRRESVKFPVPGSEESHCGFGSRKRETVLLRLRREFRRHRREFIGNVVRLDVLSGAVEVVGLVLIDRRGRLDVVDLLTKKL